MGLFVNGVEVESVIGVDEDGPMVDRQKVKKVWVRETEDDDYESVWERIEPQSTD